MHISDKKKVLEIGVDEIVPNPAQPRRFFDKDEMESLSMSIRINGLVQPVLVRRVDSYYELIAGERRLRACKMAGLKTIPCIVNDCTPYTSAVLSMTENMQRQNLQFFEEAEGLRLLIDQWQVTQEEAAYRLGKSQSAIANKLRLLCLSEDARRKINAAGLTERHARAVLRIENEQDRMDALDVIIERKLNVKQTDEYIGKVVEKQPTLSKQKKTFIIKDVRIFLNTIAHAVKTMKLGGIDAQTLQSETDEYIECIVRIPKSQTAADGKKPA